MLVLGGREFILVRKKQVWFISAELAWCVCKDTVARYFCHAGTCLHRVFFELHICTVARTLDRLEEPQPLLDSSGSRW